MVFDHLSPLVGVALLERQPLGVDAVAENCGIASVVYGSKDVSAEHDAVIGRDGLMPGDAHSIADLRARSDLGGLAHRSDLLRQRTVAQSMVRGRLRYHGVPERRHGSADALVPLTSRILVCRSKRTQVNGRGSGCHPHPPLRECPTVTP